MQYINIFKELNAKGIWCYNIAVFLSVDTYTFGTLSIYLRFQYKSFKSLFTHELYRYAPK